MLDTMGKGYLGLKRGKHLQTGGPLRLVHAGHPDLPLDVLQARLSAGPPPRLAPLHPLPVRLLLPQLLLLLLQPTPDGNRIRL